MTIHARQIAKNCILPPSLLPTWGCQTVKSKIYAIGDVHGRPDLLGRLIDTIEQHSRIERCEPCVFFLGDIVDRGPDSRGAMDIVADLH